MSITHELLSLPHLEVAKECTPERKLRSKIEGSFKGLIEANREGKISAFVADIGLEKSLKAVLDSAETTGNLSLERRDLLESRINKYFESYPDPKTREFPATVGFAGRAKVEIFSDHLDRVSLVRVIPEGKKLTKETDADSITKLGDLFNNPTLDWLISVLSSDLCQNIPLFDLKLGRMTNIGIDDIASTMKGWGYKSVEDKMLLKMLKDNKITFLQNDKIEGVTFALEIEDNRLKAHGRLSKNRMSKAIDDFIKEFGVLQPNK